MKRLIDTLIAGLGCLALLAFQAGAQSARVRDITIADGSMPVRLLGYGIVVGLDGTGDRGVGGQQGGQTVQSVANLLRRFDIQIPASVLRTRNAAAVLVTAEVSPYLRPGGKFDITISSLGDARSLRGGTLWMTPLVTDAGAQAVASAQGSLVMSDGNIASRDFNTVETSGRIPSGGLLEGSVNTASFANSSRLLLKEPDIGTATKIVAAINQAIGANTAKVEDPGSVSLTIPPSGDRAATIVKIQDLKVTPDRASRLVIDGRDGTVVAGGDITVGEALVSHGGVTLTIGGPAGTAPAAAGPNGPTGGNQAVRVATGASVQAVAAALQAVQTSPTEIAAIFESLREVGALSAEVVIR
ncbi:MAG: flagellar basal body P-ring protein FlgI [Gemmatimonadota bacterium]|nr:flagellar basal body P-ring protein FlgI [Gemmatimonadota bacterium]